MIQSFFKIPVVVPRNTLDHTGMKVDQDSLYRAYVGLVPSSFQRWNGGPGSMTAKFCLSAVSCPVLDVVQFWVWVWPVFWEAGSYIAAKKHV